jgi:hypothetical protein
MTKPNLTIEAIRQEAATFAHEQSSCGEPKLYGATDGKAVGTHIEHKFREYLDQRYDFTLGNTAKGIDFPNLNVDMKVTSIKQPQSSSPFKSARQKVCGLGYSLLVFVYEKSDDHDAKTARLDMRHTIFVESHRTADFTMSRIIREHVNSGANVEDLLAVFEDRNLPVDDIEATRLAEELLKKPPEQGYLTISNALQWRLQYNRAITEAGSIQGIIRL